MVRIVTSHQLLQCCQEMIEFFSASLVVKVAREGKSLGKASVVVQPQRDSVMLQIKGGKRGIAYFKVVAMPEDSSFFCTYKMTRRRLEINKHSSFGTISLVFTR